MKIICDTKELAKAALNCLKATSAKSENASIEGIFFKADCDAITLKGYNLELGITTTIPAKVEESGAVVLNGKIICEILRKLPGTNVVIESDQKHMTTVSSDDMTYTLVGMDPLSFPEFPMLNEGSDIKLQRDVFISMIQQTVYAVSTDAKKIIHTGIKFEISKNIISLVAIDGFRLAFRKEEISYSGEEVDFIVPSKSLSEVIKILSSVSEEDFLILVGKKHILFNLGQYTVLSRLLDGEFMNYKSVIPKTYQTTVNVDTKNMIECIDRSAVIISESTRVPIRCCVGEQEIQFNVTTPLGTATDRIQADVKGEHTEIGFNSRFLIEALRSCDTDAVRLIFNGSVAPMLIMPPEGDSFTHLILPVRLSKH